MNRFVSCVSALQLLFWTSAAIPCVIDEESPLSGERSAQLKILLNDAGFTQAQLSKAAAILDSEGKDNGAAIAQRDLGFGSGGAYIVENFNCHYFGDEDWQCESQIARYVRADNKLVRLRDGVDANAAKLALSQMRELARLDELSDKKVPKDSSILGISFIDIKDGEVRGEYSYPCGGSIVYKYVCSDDNCNLQFSHSAPGI